MRARQRADHRSRNVSWPRPASRSEAANMSTPWLSVVMPTYNGGAYLAAALESIRGQQSGGEFEVIAVDDGSEDGTVAILEEYSSRLPLRIVRRARGGNWVASTNHGLSIARGEYACLLHQDDLWMDGRLQAVRAALDAVPGVA